MMPRGRRALLAVMTSCAIVGGETVAALVASDSGADAAPPGDARVDAAPGAAGGLQDPAPAGGASTSTAVATRVEIPVIGVDSGLEQLPLDAQTGELTPPVEWMSAGWYRDGTVPGDIGPAVIAGHVDSATGPAVFLRLGELTAGDRGLVTLSDGEVREFAVDSVETAPKDAFPTGRVYGPTPSAQLRLITCDGEFDGSTGHYVDNLIVYAHLV